MKLSALNKNSGVTFIELMVVVVIIGILAGLAAPQYGALIKRKSLLSESRRITSLLKLARSEARTRGNLILVSRSAADWGGEITMKEDDGEDLATGNAFIGEEIKVSEGPGNLAIDASFNADTISFNPQGWIQGPGAFSISICISATDNTHGRLIEVNRVGKITEGPLEDDESCSL